MKNLFFMMIIFSLLSSCNSLSTIKDQNDLTKHNLKGEVIAIKYGENGNLTFFNEKGFIEKEVGFDNKGNPASYTVYLYLNNKLDKEDMRGIEGGYVKNYYYNEFGTLSSANLSANFKNGMTWSIDDKYTFDTNEKLINVVTKSNFSSGNTKYDENVTNTLLFYTNNVLDSEETNYQNGNRSISKYKNNLLISYIYYDSSGTLNNKNSQTDFEYKYDARGNWVQKSYLQDNSRIVETRDIFYKETDISKFENMYNEIKLKLEVATKDKNKTRASESENIENRGNIIIPPPSNSGSYQSQPSNYFTDVRRNRKIGYLKEGKFIFSVEGRILGKIEGDIIYNAESGSIGRKVGVIKGELVYQLDNGTLRNVVAVVKNGYIKHIDNGYDRGVIGSYEGDEINGYACAAVLLLF